MSRKPAPPISLRIKCSTSLYADLCEYRFAGRHCSMNQALTALLCAGLAAMGKPTALPQPRRPVPDETSDRPKRLVSFAGHDG